MIQLNKMGYTHPHCAYRTIDRHMSSSVCNSDQRELLLRVTLGGRMRNNFNLIFTNNETRSKCRQNPLLGYAICRAFSWSNIVKHDCTITLYRQLWLEPLYVHRHSSSAPLARTWSQLAWGIAAMRSPKNDMALRSIGHTKVKANLSPSVLHGGEHTSPWWPVH